MDSPLVNGADGILSHLTVNENTKIPEILWLKFHHEKVGKITRNIYKKYMEDNNINNNLTPITKVSALVEKVGNIYEPKRTQFPVRPAEAVSIHRSQGQTYGSVRADFTKNEKYYTLLLYVLFSRVQRLDDIYIIGEFKQPKKTVTNVIINNRIDFLRNSRKLQLSFHSELKTNNINILYNNIRSIRKNLTQIIKDDWYTQFDLLIFSETHSLNNENFEIQNFEIIYRSDENLKTRSNKGIICFSKIGKQSEVLKSYWMNYENHHLDLVVLKINNTIIITGYKSPSTPFKMFYEKIVSIIKNDLLNYQ